MQLKDRVALITGGAQGIGAAIAVHFARLGANIALMDMDEQGLESTVAKCEAESVTARAYRGNVAVESDVCRVVAAVGQDFGRLDVLVNNAGIIRDGLLVKAKDGAVLEKLSLSAWQSVIDVNLTGPFLCAREAAARMIGAGQGGVIINISSVSRHGNVGQSNYSASKAGLAAMTVVWAKELARHGIRVASIAPGFIETNIISTMRPELLQQLTAAVPLRRLGKATEIAHAAQFIVENDLFTGRCLDLDGGMRL